MSKNDRSKVFNILAEKLSIYRNAILEANIQDMIQAGKEDISLTERLKVDDIKINDMINSLHAIAVKPNPDGLIMYQYQNDEGLLFQNVSVPFGTILIIYESRPDVTIEAAAMAFKSGNTILLKGGKEARNTNLILIDLWQQSLVDCGYIGNEVSYLDFSREEIQDFISKKSSGIDLIIPRGGDRLIDFVVQNASAPVIVSGRGNNFVYVHDSADLDMAINIVTNGKTRISVCNATDKVLIDVKLLNNRSFISDLIKKLDQMDIKILGDSNFAKMSDIIEITENDKIMYEEFLSPKIMLCVAKDVYDAIRKINTYSGGHSASIVAENLDVVQIFMTSTDCAAVYHNASTRFTDGGQVGFGGEMAISTQKLHFRGPVGMDQLVTNKWMIYGKGHIR